jgi:hypothetical protein
MSRVRAGAAVCFLPAALWTLVPGHASAQNASAPQEAIEYVEHPEDGPLVDKGRKLGTNGRAYYGIDINSVLDVNVNAPKLAASLLKLGEPSAAAQKAEQLRTRLQSVQQAADALSATIRDTKSGFESWSKGDREFRTRLAASARQRRSVFDVLLRARRQRLQESMPLKDADTRAKAAFDRVLSGPNLEEGYDWGELKRLFKEELDFASEDLEKLEGDLGLGVGIQAYLISKTQQPVPVFLPNYNNEKTGPSTPYEKMKYAPSETETKLQGQYEEIAKQMQDAKSAADALKKLLQVQFDELRSDLDKIGQGAESAFAKFRAETRNLEAWSAAGKRKAWLDSVATAIAGTPQGNKVKEAWTELEQSLEQAREDVDALAAYVDLRKTTEGKTATEALDTVLRTFNSLRMRNSGLRALKAETWREHGEKIGKLIAAIDQMPAAIRPRLTGPGSPYADLKTARDALTAFADAVKNSGGALMDWLAEVFKLQGPQSVADLPVPAGNRQLPIAGNAQLGTSVNLSTIPGTRNPGDTLRVQYTFARANRDLGAGWSDTFLLQSYGWQSEVIASLAFARQAHAATWKPTAAMNWIVSYTRWPGEGKSGLGRSGMDFFSGVGISAMPLHSADGQDVQIGLGLTLAFLNNKVLLGYGTNLQADRNRGFAFLSIRVVSFPGLSSTGAATSP